MRTKKSIEEIKNFFDFSGKVAVVTGGSGGLGKALSIGLAAYGMDVVVASRKLSTLEETAAEVRALGRKALPISCDVTDEASVKAMVDAAVKEFGKVDLLVTAHGLALRHPAEEFPIDEWSKVMDINVKGTFLCAQAVARDMIAKKTPGNMVLISSIRALLGHPAGYSAYGTSKGAINLLTKQLACEWTKYKIRVNAIAPCIFWTPLTEPILNNKELYDLFMSRIPVGRAAEPEDFISAMLYLASPGSEMVTGQVLYVDGGAGIG